MPPDPLDPFLFLNLLQINSAGKITLEKMMKFNALVPEKNPEYAPDIKTFLKSLFTPFSGS